MFRRGRLPTGLRDETRAAPHGPDGGSVRLRLQVRQGVHQKKE